MAGRTSQAEGGAKLCSRQQQVGTVQSFFFQSERKGDLLVCTNHTTLHNQPQGKVLLSIQLVPEEQIKALPAGKGRSSPNTNP
jgi:hypothetical protein